MLTVDTTVRVPGYHYWSGAPDRQPYLKTVHRHLFHFTVEVEAGHPDRETEFFDLQASISFAIGASNDPPLCPEFQSFQNPRKGVTMSCEQMAAILAAYLSEEYDVIRVAVSEDGESTGTWRAD